MFKKEDIEKVIEECNKTPEDKGFVFIQYGDENPDNDRIWLGGSGKMKKNLFYMLILHLADFKVNEILNILAECTKFLEERDKTLNAEEIVKDKGNPNYEC